MKGLQKFLFKILPIITLVCFVSLGILTVFNNPNLTYINTEYMDKQTNELYVNPTEEQKDNSYSIYTFDLQSYASNIDQNILKRSITHTIELEAYQNTLKSFNTIWEDGYNFGDGVQTLINAIILVINTLILPINILLVPIRIISGILLTGMTLIGININNGTIISPMLKFFVDNLAIPLINPTYNKIVKESLPNSQWEMKNDMPLQYYKIRTVGGVTYYTNFDMTFDFTVGNVAYRRIFTDYIYENNEYHLKVWYEDTQGFQILVYDNEWFYQAPRNIRVSNNIDTENDELMDQLIYYLTSNANRTA